MCTRAKERKHYTDEDIDDDEIEGKRNYVLDDKLRSFQFEGDFVMHMRGDEFNMKFFQENGLERPIVFFEKTGLGMRVPSENFQVSDVKQCVGSRRPLDVMDANTQRGLEMTMKEWVKYYENKEREKLLNVISLEFSHTKLENYVESPTVVRQTDWVDTVWPRIYKKCQTESTNIIEKMKYPKVQKYCLMSVAGCYTDFHVDFGGTSVWYHILHGQKVFWLIPPTEVNIELYVNWVLSGKQGDIFLGDQVESCQRIILEEGYTFVIPSGWIHAVYTPKDSLVFGGNFLHSFNIEAQLTVCEIEEKTHVPQKFRYPFFHEISWYVIDRYLACLTGKSFLLKSAIEAEKDEDSELDDSRPPSRDPEDYTERIPNRSDDKDAKSSQHKLSKSITIELTRIDEKNNRSGRKTDANDAKGREAKRSRSPVDDKSETEETPGDKDSKDDLLKDGSIDGSKFIPKKNLHLTEIERRGLEKLVVWLEQLPATKKNVPKDISDPESLLKEFKQLLIDHQNDDSMLATSGEPILQWPPSKKLKPKLKMGHLGKGKLSSKNAAAQAASNIRRRRTRCKKCEPCTRQECAECHFCKDMKKFGGPGRMKQSCISRQCMAPVLPLSASCMICGKEGASAEKGDNSSEESVSALMECGICWEIVHPNCFKQKNENIEGEGVVNEDLPNSWECPKCCQDGKRGQIKVKPRVIKSQPKPKAIESRHSSTSSDDFPPETQTQTQTQVPVSVKQETPPLFEGKRVTAKESNTNIVPTLENPNMPDTKNENPIIPKTEIKDETPTPSLTPKVELLEEKEIPTKRKPEQKVVPVKTEEKSVALKKRKLTNGRRKCGSSQLGSSFVTRSVRRVKRSSSSSSQMSSRLDAAAAPRASSSSATSTSAATSPMTKRPKRERLVDRACERQPSTLRFQLRQRSQRQKRQKAMGRGSRGGAGPVRQAAVAAQAKLMAVDMDLPLDEDEEFMRCDRMKIEELRSSSVSMHRNDLLCLNLKTETGDDEIDGQQDQHSMADVQLKPPIYVVRPAPVPPPPDFIVTETTGEEHALHVNHWKLIFSFLGPADLARCMCVCKTWNRWCISPTLWTNIDLSHRKIKQKHLIGTVCRQPKNLNLTSAFFSAKQLTWLLARLPQLKELVVSNCCWAALSALCSSSCPLLRTIDLSWASGVHEECFQDLILPPADRQPGMNDVSRLSKLRSFIARGTEITDNVIDLLKEYIPQLEILDLSYCMRITDQAVANMACSSSFCQKLKRINFSGSRQITNDCLRYLMNFESIEYMDFKLCNQVTTAALETFTSTYTNQKLKVTKEKIVTTTIP